MKTQSMSPSRRNHSPQFFLDGKVFTNPGDGNIDFKSVLAYLVGHQYSGWIIVAEAEQGPKKYNPLNMRKKVKAY